MLEGGEGIGPKPFSGNGLAGLDSLPAAMIPFWSGSRPGSSWSKT